MCYDADALPPLTTAPVTAVAEARPLTLTSADGAEIAAFLARPERASGVGVVVLPDNRGLSRFYENLACHLAGQGHTALAVDYFGRSAGTAYRERGPEFAALDRLMPHLAALTRDGVYGDIGAAVDFLRTPAGGECAAVTTLGFCLGGRFAYLSAARRFGLAGAIGLYGYPEPVRDAPGPTQLAADLSAPILAIFGGADEGIPASTVDAFDRALTAAGVEHEIVTYPGAPHGFFEAHQGAFAAECADAWRRILAVLDQTRAAGRQARR